MTNLNNITGTVSSKKKAGVTVTLADGRRGFLPTAAFGDANPKKGDKLTVDILSEEKGLLQLALSKKEENMETKIVNRFEERIGALVAAAPASCTPAPIFIDEAELALSARRTPEITFPGHGLDLGQMPVNDFTRMVFGVEIPAEAVDGEEGQCEELSKLVGADANVSKPQMFVLGVTNPLAGGLDPVADRWQADEISPLLLAAIDDAKTCLLDSVPADRLLGWPAGYEPPLFGETEHSCGFLDVVTDRDVSEDKGTAPVLNTASEKSPGDGQSGSAKGFWAQLRAMADSEKNLRLTFKRVNGQPGLVAMYRGVRCFLPTGEMPRNFDINSVPAEGSEQWVKIISISKPKRSMLVSMRIRMPRAELLKVSESKTAESKNQKEVQAKAAATRVANAAVAEKDYEWLCDGQEVHGEVVKILKKTGKGDKPFVMYFVRVGTQLAGVLREVHVPFEQGTRRPRVFKVGDRVKVRVIRKFRGKDKTGADVPKVDLTMRRPENSKSSKGQHGKPRVWTFGEAQAASQAAPSQVLNEVQGKGKGKGRKGKGNGKGKGGHQNPKSTGPGTAIGDALIAAFAAAHS
ncbi:MAG: hypothetical protein U0103_24480 [Candidatus Obscuribacterales bacterium]